MNIGLVDIDHKNYPNIAQMKISAWHKAQGHNVEWKNLLQQLIDSNAYIDFNQGIDARMLTEEKISMLNSVKLKEIHFAWDRYKDKSVVLPKLQLYSDIAKHKPHQHNAIVYVLVNYDSTFEEDLERIYTLKELGYWAFVMIYDKAHCNRRYKDLARWCNNRFLFGSIDKFEDYKH